MVKVWVDCGSETIVVEVLQELWDATALPEGDVAFLTLSLGRSKQSVIKFREPFYV